MCRGSSTPRPADLQPIFRTEQRPQLPPRPPRGPIFAHDVVRAKPVAGDRSFENSSGRPSVAATSPRESRLALPNDALYASPPVRFASARTVLSDNTLVFLLGIDYPLPMFCSTAPHLVRCHRFRTLHCLPVHGPGTHHAPARLHAYMRPHPLHCASRGRRHGVCQLPSVALTSACMVRRRRATARSLRRVPSRDCRYGNNTVTRRVLLSLPALCSTSHVAERPSHSIGPRTRQDETLPTLTHTRIVAVPVDP